MPADIRTNVPEKTLRTKAVDNIITALKDLLFKPLAPNATTNPKLFDNVEYGILEDINVRETPGCRVQEGEEEKDDAMYMKSTKKLRLYIHFKIVNINGVDQTSLINYYLGRIAAALITPENFEDWGIMDLDEVGNQIISNGETDPEPGATVWYDMEYRHTVGDYFTE